MSRRIRCVLPLLAACLPVALAALPHDWRFLPLHLSLLASVLWIAWRAPVVDRALEDAPVSRWLLMAASSAALVCVLVGGSPRASWGMIDDHEIHVLIGSGRDRIPADELPAMIKAHPEIGSPPFTITRYRPTYYLFRLAEASAWGKRIEPWMILRLVLFTVTATLAFDLLRQWLGFVAGGVALAFLATLWMWPKIFGTLGPAESYAAPAVMAFAWCASAILRRPAAGGSVLWACLAIAAVVAIGAKENFVVLAALAALVAGVEWRRGRLGPAGVVACVAIMAAAAWVAFVVGSSIAAQGGRDLYDRPLGLSGFVRSDDRGSLRAVRKLLGYGLPLVGATAWMGVAWLRARDADASRRRLLAVGTVLGMVALSQFVFYRGEVFKKSHYDLPFVPVVCLLLIGMLVVASGWRLGSATARRRTRRLLVPGALAVAAMALGGDHARLATRAYAEETRSFRDLLERVAVLCGGNADMPVEFLLGPDPAGQYEPVHSVADYLRTMGVRNPFFISPRHLPDSVESVAAGRLTHELAGLSRDGDKDFEPSSRFGSARDHITLSFGIDPPAGGNLAFRVR